MMIRAYSLGGGLYRLATPGCRYDFDSVMAFAALRRCGVLFFPKRYT